MSIRRISSTPFIFYTLSNFYLPDCGGLSMRKSFYYYLVLVTLAFKKKKFFVVVLCFGFCFLNILQHSGLTRSVCVFLNWSLGSAPLVWLNTFPLNIWDSQVAQW